MNWNTTTLVTSILIFVCTQLYVYNLIYFSFIIGGDGKVYEGAGFHKVGAHTRGYNTRSLGIAFIGNFQGS